MEKSAKYSRQYRKRKGVKEHRRRYMRKYMRFIYHLDEEIAEVLADVPATVVELSKRLSAKYGFTIRPNTLEKYMQKFTEEHSMAPFKIDSIGRYHINNQYNDADA